MSEITSTGVEDRGPVSGRPDRLARVPWTAIVVYIAVAFGASWLIALPLWLKSMDEPGYAALFQALVSLMMFTPLLATLVVVFVMRVPRGQRMRFLGMWPLRPAKRVVWFIVLSLFVPIVLVAVCYGLSAAFGWVRLDLVGFAGFEQIINAQLDAAGLDQQTLETTKAMMPPISLLAWGQLAAIPLVALMNSFVTLGEELGWRGWLLPALRPLGLWPALLASGAIWGLWHSPVILLGYNFNRTDIWGVLLMTGGCMAWGVLFGWVRLRSGSIWPAVIGHGALNAAASSMMVVTFAADQTSLNMALVNPLGVPGYIVIAVVVLILVISGQFGREPELAAKRVRGA